MSEPRAKKTTLACDQCRRRKRKCDGQTPICSACGRGNVECVYTANMEQRRPLQKNYVAALEARIALLEQILKSAESSDISGSSHQTSPSRLDDGSLRQSLDTTPASSPGSTPAIPSLTDNAADALKSTLDPTSREDTSEELGLGMEGYETLLSLELEHKLLAQFWDWQRMHHPYVAPVPFLSAYAIHSEVTHPGERIPSPPLPPQNLFAGTALNVPRASDVQRTSDLPQFISPLLLYSMFAIAALFHGDTETSTMFYQRVERTFFEEAANPRVATVQAVCLMATWELGHARSPAAWTLLGVGLSLCIRLGLNVDATPLLQSGAISQRLFETRNFVFWATFNTERFYATCMGMRPLIDRRIINTPKHSSPSADTIKPNKTTARPKDKMHEAHMAWWSPSSLGMGDALVQAAWDAIRDLCQMTDDLFDSVYATDASTRTPQEILELVGRNHLTIQKFIDNLPTWLRSTGAIRRKESGLVYIHLFIHLTSILTNRPFLSSHHTASPVARQYRTLAFRVARASALQVSSLIRHIPLSSPCVTLPYVVYSACTVLLLAPEDPAAMDGVRTGLACLDGMDETGYWVESARDAARRIRALAERWGVGLESSRRVLGPVGGSVCGGVSRAKVQRSSPVEGELSPAVSTRPSTSAGSAITHTPPITPRTSQLATLPSVSGGGYFAVSEYCNPSSVAQDVLLVTNVDAVVNWALQGAEPTPGNGAILNVQAGHSHLCGEHMGIPGYEPAPPPTQPDHYPPQYQPLLRSASYHPYKRAPKKHVAYATGHADPQHDMNLPHSHWHSIIPSTDLNFPVAPDPSACADMGMCFSYTVEHGQDPAFVDQVGDPYAGVSMDWVGDVGSNFRGYHGEVSGFPALVGGFAEQLGRGDAYGYPGTQTWLGF
ncbi:unnamed protein product [Rhizoctonia solani]|uniref:Zn(2)-C6 fungal-type domain-containing protein n=1 Tax=Rhizoctonia solani TaxID=456999 RepID=A0A8H3DJZ6_9AGAM|nr:unnamed protein product [Rhizoctonia solani]